MAFVSSVEINDARDGTDSQAKEKSTHTRVRTFRVIMSSPTDTADMVLAQCPILCAPYPGYPSLVLLNRHAAPLDKKNKLVWIVTLTYGLMDASSDPNNNPQQPNPIDDARQIDWATETIQEQVWEDKDGKAILNSAGDYFENGVTRDRTSWSVTITQNVVGVPAWIDTFRDAINATECIIDGVNFDAYQCKVRAITISRWMQRNFIPYRVLKIVIAIRDDWRKYILDEGLNSLNNKPYDPNFGKKVPAVLANGQKTTRPVPLDGNGHVLDPSTPATAVFIQVNLYNQMQFSVLPIQ